MFVPLAEEALVAKVVGKGSRKGTTPFDRFGNMMQRPPSWAAVAGALALVGGDRGRRAGLRGAACYLAASAAHLPLKALVGRRHPRGSALFQAGPFTSSFPSGHAASDLAFVLGAAQEIPVLVVPLSGATLAVHWTLVRKRSHYPSDVLAGGALGVLVALAAWKLFPPKRTSEHREAASGGEEVTLPGVAPAPKLA